MSMHDVTRRTSSPRALLPTVYLGLALACVAGAINVIGLLAVNQYTTHMTGIVSAISGHLAAGTAGLALAGLAALLAFAAGAACSTVLVRVARRRGMPGVYAWPLLLEAVLLLGFGLGGRMGAGSSLHAAFTVMLLAFAMGVQNALISKLSHAEIRTTHMTGIITDIGIELGKRLAPDRGAPAQARSWARLGLLSALLGCFLAGGIGGALGFRYAGPLATVPLALLLMALASMPLIGQLLPSWRRTG